MKSTTKKKLGTAAWIIFIASFASYLILIFTAIFGMNISFMGESNWETGGVAVVFVAIVTCLIPILPISIIYQILYGITLSRASDKRKKIARILIISTLALILIPTCIHDTYKVYLNKKFYKDNYPKVEAYMENQFSEELMNTVKTVDYNRKDKYIIVNVKCDLGKGASEYPDGTMNVYYYIDDDGSVRDNFSTLFGSTFNNDFNDGLCEYVKKQRNLPDNWNISVNIDSVDLTHYKPGDSAESVYPYCKYDSKNIRITMDKYSDSALIDEVNLFRDKYKEYFPQDVSFTVIIDDQYYALVFYYSNNKGYILTVNGYTYENSGPTVAYHELTVHD